MRAFVLGLILLPACLVAQDQNKDAEISPAVKSAVVDALSCVRALDDVAIKSDAVFGAQLTRCDELISKVDLLGSTKTERWLHGRLFLAAVDFKLGHDSWNVARYPEAKQSFASARGHAAEVEDKIKSKPAESADAKK